MTILQILPFHVAIVISMLNLLFVIHDAPSIGTCGEELIPRNDCERVAAHLMILVQVKLLQLSAWIMVDMFWKLSLNGVVDVVTPSSTMRFI